MKKFNSAYKKILLEQKKFFQKLKNKTIISQANPFSWIGDKLLKPIGGTLEGVADTVAGLATADLKKAGAGLQKTVQNPVQLVTNTIKAPVDIVDGAIDLVKSGNVPPQVQQAAKKIPPSQLKIIKKKNPNIAKLPPVQQAQAAAAAGYGYSAQQAIKKVQQNSAKPAAKAAAKLTDKEQELIDILAQSRNMDANAAKKLFLQYKAKGKVIIYNGKKKKLMILSLKKFTATPDKYIAFAKKVNLNSDDAQMQDDFSEDEEVQNYVKLAVPFIAKKLNKDPKMIETRMNRRIKKGQIFVINKDGKVIAIKIEDFKKNVDSYMEEMEDKNDQTKKDDDAKAKANDKDKKAQKLLQYLVTNAKDHPIFIPHPVDGLPAHFAPTSVQELIRHWKQVGPQIAKLKGWHETSKAKEKFELIDNYAKTHAK